MCDCNSYTWESDKVSNNVELLFIFLINIEYNIVPQTLLLLNNYNRNL